MSLIGRIKPGALVRLKKHGRAMWGRLAEVSAGHPVCEYYAPIAKVSDGYVYIGFTDRAKVRAEDVIFKGPYAVAKPRIEDWDESRLDIIGQNGNDGLHYPTS